MQTTPPAFQVSEWEATVAIAGTGMGMNPESGESKQAVVSAEITLLDCNPDCNPATKNETNWVLFESQIYLRITLKRSRLERLSLRESTWVTESAYPCERDALPTELYPHFKLTNNSLAAV